MTVLETLRIRLMFQAHKIQMEQVSLAFYRTSFQSFHRNLHRRRNCLHIKIQSLTYNPVSITELSELQRIAHFYQLTKKKNFILEHVAIKRSFHNQTKYSLTINNYRLPPNASFPHSAQLLKESQIHIKFSITQRHVAVQNTYQ